MFSFVYFEPISQFQLCCHLGILEVLTIIFFQTINVISNPYWIGFFFNERKQQFLLYSHLGILEVLTMIFFQTIIVISNPYWIFFIERSKGM